MAPSTKSRGTMAPVEQMVVIHRIFRHDLDQLVHLVQRCPDGHRGWAANIGQDADFLIAGIHHHHGAEDEFLWPLLRARAPAALDLCQRLEHQHQMLAGILDGLKSPLDEWRRMPDPKSRDALVAALATLRTAFVEHLDLEEAEILPIAGEHLSMEEWQRIGDRSFDGFDAAQKLTAMGQLLDVATPEEAKSFLAELPLPIRLMWKVIGRRRYELHRRHVLGDANPTLSRWMHRANRLAVALYRWSRGRIGGTAKGVPVGLLTVAGRVTGEPHTNPVGYIEHHGDYLVSGSAGGSISEPQWFRNVRVASHVQMEMGTRRQTMRCRVVDAAERERLWHEAFLPASPAFAKYEQRGRRPIPVAVLTPAEQPEAARADETNI